jgi:hypothetical protein
LLVLYVSQHNFTGNAAMLPVKLCWLTYNTSNDAVYRICSNAPSEVVLTDVQYKQWCSTSYMQQCSQWSCVDWHTIQAMMQYILYATSVNTTSLGALLHIRCTASLLVLYVSQHNFTGSIAAYKMYCIIACIVCQSTQLHYILYAAMLPVKLCWLTYNTSDDAVHLICSNAPSEVVLTDIQYKRWCSTSVNTTSLGALLHIRCTASLLVLYVSQHNFTGSIAAYKMYCIIACIVCQSTQLHWEHCCIYDILHHRLYCMSVNTTSLGALLHKFEAWCLNFL